MSAIPVLLEGASDQAVMAQLLLRRFGLMPARDFSLHPHQGKGQLLSKPSQTHRGLLHQLPNKLKGFSHLPLVLVLMDLDDDDLNQQIQALNQMLQGLSKKPAKVLFCFAIEETESWFIADTHAVQRAYPKARVKLLQKIEPDAIVGAWEKLAEALGVDSKKCKTKVDKVAWAEKIAPHLDFQNPSSPSLRKVIQDIEAQLRALPARKTLANKLNVYAPALHGGEIGAAAPVGAEFPGGLSGTE